MSEKTIEILKSHINYDNLDKLISRKDIIIKTTMNAIERENNSNNNFKLEYNDSQVISKENGTYSLMILINKKYN